MISPLSQAAGNRRRPINSVFRLLAVLSSMAAIWMVTPDAASAASTGAAYTCVGPSPAAQSFVARARQEGIHAEQDIYDQSRVGCIPLAANGGPETGLIQTALAQQRRLPVVAAGASGTRRNLSTFGSSWAPIGPAPVGSGGDADSGRVLALAYDAGLNGGTLFLGSADGGVWTSTSPFTSWKTTTDSLPNLAIGTLAVDPANPEIVYAGTGEYTYPGDGLFGTGIYKTTDGGTSWAPVTGAPASGWGYDQFSRIEISSTGTVYAGFSAELGSGGVAISTDGGSTWSLGQGVAGTNVITDVAIDGAGNVYAASQSRGTAGVYECLSPCSNSSTWTLIGGGSSGADGFPDAASVANIRLTTVHTTAGGGGAAVFAIADNPSNYGLAGVYRLLPGSSTWTQVASSSTAPTEAQGWYNLYIWADPADSTGGTVYFGMEDIFKTTTATSSTPSWSNLTNVYNGGLTGVHTDQHAVASNGGTLFFGNDGGVWKTSDGGKTFTDLNGNLATLQFYGGAVGTDPDEGCQANCDPTARIGGTQDNGTVQTTNGALSWTPDPGFGDGGPALIDPANNNIRYGQNAFDGSGFTFVASTDGFKTYSNGDPTGTCGNSDFYAPQILAPGTGNVLVGDTDLCLSSNHGQSWVDLSSSIGQNYSISAIAASNAGGMSYYFANQVGQTWFSTNGGAKWTEMDTGTNGSTPLAAIKTMRSVGPSTTDGYISAMAADPTHQGIVYAVLTGFQGHSAGHVFKWTDTGGVNGTWSDISGSLPDEPYDTVTVNPANTSQILVGGVTGAFISTDGGSTWNQLGGALPNAYVDDLEISPDGNTVVAFTHGRSAWQLTLPSSVTVTVAASGVYGSTPKISIPAGNPAISTDPSGEAASMTGTLSCATTATAASHVSSTAYGISGCGGLSDGSRLVKYNYGGSGYTVKPAPLSVTVKAQSVAYNSDYDHGFDSSSVSVSGLASGDTTASLGGRVNSTYVSGDHAGQYSLNGSITDKDYTPGFTPGTLTVSKATPKLSWSPVSPITYGTALSSTQLDATASVSGSFSYSPAWGRVLHAGTSQKLLATFAPADSADYVSGGTVSETITVNPAPLTVTAAKASVVYGSTMPKLRFTAGFVNRDTAASLKTAPLCKTTAKEDSTKHDTSGAGTYPITCGGAASPDYSPIKYVSNKLTVKLAPVRTAYTGPTTIKLRSAVQLTAKLSAVSGSAIRARLIKFVIGTGTRTQTCSGTTNAKGIATCRIGKMGSYSGAARIITVTFAGDPKGSSYDFLPGKTTASFKETS